MHYNFVAPKMELAGYQPVPGWTQKPEILRTQLFDHAAATDFARLVIAAHMAGQSAPSRTRYAQKQNKDWDVNKAFRSSKNVPPSLEGMLPAFAAMQAFAEQSLPAFGVDARAYTVRSVDDQCLFYQEGDYVCDHADDSALDESDGLNIWRPVKPDRHLVGIVWLTSQRDEVLSSTDDPYAFSGGELRVNSLVDAVNGTPLSVIPQAGTMVLFPANPWYRHEVLPVRGGNRVALTTWWKICAKTDEE